MLSRLHPLLFLACVFILLSLPSQHGEAANLILQLIHWLAAQAHCAVGKAHGSPARPAHCALEAVVVVEAAPLAEAAVKREFWMDSAEVEVA